MHDLDLFITNITAFNPFLSVNHYSLNFVIRYSFSAAQSIIELYSTKLQSFTVSTESHSTYRITQCRQNYIAQSCRITQQKGTGCGILQYRAQRKAVTEHSLTGKQLQSNRTTSKQLQSDRTTSKQIQSYMFQLQYRFQPQYMFQLQYKFGLQYRFQLQYDLQLQIHRFTVRELWLPVTEQKIQTELGATEGVFKQLHCVHTNMGQ